MPIQLNWVMYLIVCPLCFLAGCVDAIAGGGGLISLPAYLLAGLPPKLTAGTNKLSASIGCAMATRRFIFDKRVIWRCALPAAALALPGSALGTMLLNSMGDQQILRMLVLILPVVSAVVLLRRGALTPLLTLPEKAAPALCAVIGLLIGFYDGLIGPGTGTFLILLFTLVVGMHPVDASGSAKIVNLASNVASLCTQIVNGHVLFALGLPAALFSAMGGALGARLAIRGGEKTVRGVLLAVLALLFLTLAVKAFV